ncbi:MAG: phosphoribosylformylglycinamidine synthase I [Spirochaetes bacterium]|nr:phosphoribosylformylglycinamidine synthase I [Spirochaetota bacterium]
MATPRALILTGYGINCDEETRFAFALAGAEATIVHINDIIENTSILNNYQIFAFPGGFSYGDDTGSGKALANKIKNNLSDEMYAFLQRDTLMIGICNGFQVMVNLGIVPGLTLPFGKVEVSLEHNATFRFQCRWIDLKINPNSNCVFTKGIDMLHIPVAHGEGNFVAPQNIIDALTKNNQIIMQYSKPDGTLAHGQFPYNPNGSMLDIAAICDTTGRIMGMMPHPERHIYFMQRDDWTYLREEYKRNKTDMPVYGEGLKIFKNAVEYFL